jgi:ParB/RepB/Spo0J family partition protein
LTDLLDLAPETASRPAAGRTRLTEDALRNADILRRLALPAAPPTAAALARELGRDESNLRKTLQHLVSLQLITVSQDALAPFGQDQLGRIEAAERGSAAIPDGFALLAHGDIRPDPHNARTSSHDAASLEELAESLHATDGPLQPPGVRPAGLDGVHQLVFGERRWRAWGLLIGRGVWAPDRRFLCPVRTGSEAELAEAAIVENAQRSDLSNLELAEAFLRLVREFGRTPDQIAAQIGKTLRFVEIAVQVAEKATDEDKARFRDAEAARRRGEKADYTWTALRESVRDRKPRPPLDLSPKLNLALAEVADAAERRPGTTSGVEGFVRLSRPPTGGPLDALSDRKLVDLKVTAGAVWAKARTLGEAGPQLTALGFYEGGEPGRAACLRTLRAAVVGELSAGTYGPGLYCLPELAPPPTPVPAPPPPEARRGESAEEAWTPLPDSLRVARSTDDGLAQAAPLPAPAPAQPELPALTAYETLILLEVAAKTAAAPATDPSGALTGCLVSSDYRLDAAVQPLVMKRLLRFAMARGNRFLIALTETGAADLRTRLDLAIEDAAGLRYELDQARLDADRDPAEGRWAVEWLNEPEAEAADPVEGAAPTAPATETSPQRAAEAWALDTLAREEPALAAPAELKPARPVDAERSLEVLDKVAGVVRDIIVRRYKGAPASRIPAEALADSLLRAVGGGSIVGAIEDWVELEASVGPSHAQAHVRAALGRAGVDASALSRWRTPAAPEAADA